MAEVYYYVIGSIDLVELPLMLFLPAYFADGTLFIGFSIDSLDF